MYCHLISRKAEAQPIRFVRSQVENGETGNSFDSVGLSHDCRTLFGSSSTAAAEL